MSTLVASNNEKTLVRLSVTLGKFREKLVQALPKNRNVDQEISSVIATVASSPSLQRCTPESIALAAYDAATLGLPVNKLGLAWLVPFGNEAKLQIGYRGYIQLVIESGYVLDVNAECVYENDRFKYTLGSNPNIEHEPAIKGQRGNFIAVYAIARLLNGISKHVVMSKEQVDHIRSKSRSASNGPWMTDYDEMSKKTVIKRLCKLLPYNLPGLQKVELASELETHYQETFAKRSNKNTTIDFLSNDTTIEIMAEEPNNHSQNSK
ncbi:MAG: recombinase RecT [Acidobacteria bacterium]|nr:recombinase RecT [Acidobacteriota bacterium]